MSKTIYNTPSIDKLFKFTDTVDRKLYITGCTHFFHKQSFIWEKRGYSSVDDHLNGLINIINTTCRSTDVLFILGDFTLNCNDEQFYQLINRIQPEIFHCYGNHNHPIQDLYKQHCIEKFGYEVIGYKWLDKITSWGHYIDGRWNGQFCCWGHYPFAVFNKMHHNSWSLHSHNHGSYGPSLPTDKTNKQLDCGWDVHAKPLSFQDIQKIMNNKSFKQLDHHDKDTN